MDSMCLWVCSYKAPFVHGRELGLLSTPLSWLLHTDLVHVV